MLNRCDVVFVMMSVWLKSRVSVRLIMKGGVMMGSMVSRCRFFLKGKCVWVVMSVKVRLIVVELVVVVSVRVSVC